MFSVFALSLSTICPSTIHLFSDKFQANCTHQSPLPVSTVPCIVLTRIYSLCTKFSRRSNLSIVKYTDYKCAIWWILTDVYFHVTRTPIKIGEHFLPLREFPQIPSHSVPGPTLEATTFLSFHHTSVLPVQELCINGIILYLLFCVNKTSFTQCVVLRFIHVFACITSLFFFIVQ